MIQGDVGVWVLSASMLVSLFYLGGQLIAQWHQTHQFGQCVRASLAVQRFCSGLDISAWEDTGEGEDGDHKMSHGDERSSFCWASLERMRESLRRHQRSQLRREDLRFDSTDHGSSKERTAVQIWSGFNRDKRDLCGGYRSLW